MRSINFSNLSVRVPSLFITVRMRNKAKNPMRKMNVPIAVYTKIGIRTKTANDWLESVPTKQVPERTSPDN